MLSCLHRLNRKNIGATTAPTAIWPVLGVPATTPNGYYTIAVDSAGATSFLMTATPNAGTSQASDACGTFAVNQMGLDTSTGYANSECW